MPLQAGSWLMSIFEGFGAVPSNFTVPLTVATVAGSIGVAAGAACCCDMVLLDCSVFSFLLQAASIISANRANTLTTIIFDAILLSMMSFLSSELKIGNFVSRNVLFLTGHSSANRRSPRGGIPPPPAYDQRFAAGRLSSHAASTLPLSFAPPALAGRYSQ